MGGGGWCKCTHLWVHKICPVGWEEMKVGDLVVLSKGSRLQRNWRVAGAIGIVMEVMNTIATTLQGQVDDHQGGLRNYDSFLKRYEIKYMKRTIMSFTKWTQSDRLLTSSTQESTWRVILSQSLSEMVTMSIQIKAYYISLVNSLRVHQRFCLYGQALLIQSWQRFTPIGMRSIQTTDTFRSIPHRKSAWACKSKLHGIY